MPHTAARSIAAGIALIAIVTAPIVFAADFTSDSFLMQNAETSDFGGAASSSSFSSDVVGGEISNTEASSTSFVLNAGPMFFDSFTPYAQNWRWYDDENNETPVSALANENTAPQGILDGDILKLRITVVETAGFGLEGAKFKLQFATSSIFEFGGTDVSEMGECTGSAHWCYADGADDDGDGISSSLLSDSDICASGIGDGCGTHNESGTTTSAFTHPANGATEYEFTVTQNAAQLNTVYFFRLVEVNSGTFVPLNTGETHPSLATGGASLTFMIEGLPNATNTEGVTTDVTTTPTNVPFGTLFVNNAVEAAHRFTVSTNASNGYRIFAFQRQGLLSPNTEISPVTGTNDTPLGWNASCEASATGCYGYHAGEDVLAGGSTRFAADDTFARFTTSPAEIAYSGMPVENKTTDIVYKIQAREEQEAGEYSSVLVFIITPVF